ncbi:glucosamine-6-phosphate deaminase [Cryptococcus sp. DSM 104549]
MQLQTFPNHNTAAAAVASLIIARIKAFAPTQNHKFVLCLPTGGTPIPVYEELARRCRAREISFEHVVTVNLDEYVGLGPKDHQSYNHFMEEHFFSQVDIPPAQTHLFLGLSPPTEACAAYESLISSLGGIHLLFLGLGPNGHVAFNEPGSSLASRTRVITLAPSTVAANARFFDEAKGEEVPKQAMSMGLGTILEAGEVVMLVSGKGKAEALREAVEGSVRHMCPASALQMHENVSVFADEQAVSELQPSTIMYLKAQVGADVDASDASGLPSPLSIDNRDTVCSIPQKKRNLSIVTDFSPGV